MERLPQPRFSRLGNLLIAGCSVAMLALAEPFLWSAIPELWEAVLETRIPDLSWVFSLALLSGVLFGVLMFVLLAFYGICNKL